MEGRGRQCFGHDIGHLSFGADVIEVEVLRLDALAQVRDGLAKLDEWTGEAASAVVKQVSADNEVGMGKVAQPIRIAVTGGPVSPSIDDTLVLLGRDETLARLDAAVAAFASEPG